MSFYCPSIHLHVPLLLPMNYIAYLHSPFLTRNMSKTRLESLATCKVLINQ